MNKHQQEFIGKEIIIIKSSNKENYILDTSLYVPKWMTRYDT
jgi:hypothetical protein